MRWQLCSSNKLQTKEAFRSLHVCMEHRRSLDLQFHSRLGCQVSKLSSWIHSHLQPQPQSGAPSTKSQNNPTRIFRTSIYTEGQESLSSSIQYTGYLALNNLSPVLPIDETAQWTNRLQHKTQQPPQPSNQSSSSSRIHTVAHSPTRQT